MTEPLDPAVVVADFIARVSPDDPAPESAPVALLSIRTARGDEVIARHLRQAAVAEDGARK